MPGMVTRRRLELLTGLLTGAFGLAVILSSVAVGAGWSEAGVQSGTFPLISGVLILGGSLVNLARGLVGPDPVLAGPGELKRLAGLFLPAAVFVAAIPFIGIYVAGAAYLLWVLSVQHDLAWWRSGLIAAATVLMLYWVFEQTFQVLLPRGWLGAVLGF
jgi:hypothetical protein